MKITIKMRRGQGTSWCGNIKKQAVTACPSDVMELFAMGRARNATCEISNARPRGHEDYHVFEFNKWGNYGSIETTPGNQPAITTRTSRIIRNAFSEKKQKVSPIYVSFY